MFIIKNTHQLRISISLYSLNENSPLISLSSYLLDKSLDIDRRHIHY